MLSRVMMQDFTSRQMRQGVGILYSSHDDLLHHVAHLRRAVIVEEAVSVFAILRLAVLDECSQQAVCLGRRQVQFLLGDAGATPVIVDNEVLPGERLYHVVRLPKHEVPDEVGLTEVEDAVVEDLVYAVLRHLHANGGVSIEGIHLLPRRAGEK